MNQIMLGPNEFVIRVIDDGTQLQYLIDNPHTRPGADGVYNASAFSAAHAMISLAGKIKRVRKTIKQDDDSDPELYG